MHLFAVPVQQPGSNGRRKLSFVIETDLGQGVRDIVGRVDEQFTLDDAQHIGRNPGMEIDLAASGLPNIGLEELGDRSDEFRRGGTAMQWVARRGPGRHQVAGASGPRSTPVRSFTDAE